MTSDKALKRDIRARMAKTGESYTTARHFLLDQHLPAQPTEPLESAGRELQQTAAALGPDAERPLPPRVAEPEMSDDAVSRATGKGWDEWFQLLDDWGATSRTHAEIAKMLGETYPIGGWWAQSVTVGYERARGMRAINQRPDGFTASVSRTFPVQVERLYAAFADERIRDQWIEPELVRYRSSTPNKVWRFDIPDDASRVEARMTAKAEAKASVAIQHTRLTSADDVLRWKQSWTDRFARLQTLISEGVA